MPYENVLGKLECFPEKREIGRELSTWPGNKKRLTVAVKRCRALRRWRHLLELPECLQDDVAQLVLGGRIYHRTKESKTAAFAVD